MKTITSQWAFNSHYNVYNEPHVVITKKIEFEEEIHTKKITYPYLDSLIKTKFFIPRKK